MWSNTLDQAIGIHAQALQLRERRASLLASNIANADTPNYKAKDVDFHQALARMNSATKNPVRTDARHLGSGAGQIDAQDVQYRTALQPSLDGNTVEPQKEYMEFSRNTIQYQISLRLLGDRFKSLRGALTGE